MTYRLLAFTALFVAWTSASRLSPERHGSDGMRVNIPVGHPPINWMPAGRDDVRAPCPMLNTLANHGYLPHDGKNITKKDTIRALKSALNIEEELSQYLFQEALTTNPTKSASTFSLDDLSRHNILEHDASLSRLDYYFGDNHDFNQEVFDQTRSYWKEPIITVQHAANAREARVKNSNATNPTFGISDLGLAFGYGETAAYIIVLGNKTTGRVDRSWVEYLFENERLPLELGWTKREDSISMSDLEDMSQQVINATNNSDDAKLRMMKRGDIHIGRKS